MATVNKHQLYETALSCRARNLYRMSNIVLKNATQEKYQIKKLE